MEQTSNTNQNIAEFCTVKLIRNIYVTQKVVVIAGVFWNYGITQTNELPKISAAFELFPLDVTLKLAQLVPLAIFARSGIVSKFRLLLKIGDSLHLRQYTTAKPTLTNYNTWKILFVN